MTEVSRACQNWDGSAFLLADRTDSLHPVCHNWPKRPGLELGRGFAGTQYAVHDIGEGEGCKADIIDERGQLLG